MANGNFVAEDRGLIAVSTGGGVRLKILLSYWYYKDTDLDELFAKYFSSLYPQVFADSGGFSAYTQGYEIKPEDYAKWVKRWAHLFTTYANLDVIGSHMETMNNQRHLEELGLSPVPVFHAGSSYDDLKKLVEEYQYIALGGLVPHMKQFKKVMPHLVKCFQIARGKAVFHGFGVTSWRVLKAFPWYSVDSSSWGSGFRYGRVPVFDDRRGAFIALRLGDRGDWAKHSHVVREMGFDPQDFYDRERNDRAKICAISALSYLKAEDYLRRLHGPVYIPKRQGEAVVPRLHLADANPTRFADALQGAGVRLHLADTSNGINYGDADSGLRAYLADASGHSGGDLRSAMTGMKLYLVERSGDISRANEQLSSREVNLL